MPVLAKCSLRILFGTRIGNAGRAGCIWGLETFRGRTRPARTTHSGLHSKPRQQPRLQDDPNNEDAYWNEVFHFLASVAFCGHVFVHWFQSRFTRCHGYKCPQLHYIVSAWRAGKKYQVRST
jgi:hypothetical protein